ncbi:MAG TPA: hypothetical protein VKY92_07960, partial [Verrucomicrobiae bacterium]|nr:hypothetical protein [Verrucomicrobiae bacterium]
MHKPTTPSQPRRRAQAKAAMLACGIAAACLTVNPGAQADEREQSPPRPQLEPNAGSWRTWVISSGKDFRVPPPPGERETRKELKALEELISHNDAQAQQQIEFWDAGSPAYRWMDLINARLLAGTPTTAFSHRVQT